MLKGTCPQLTNDDACIASFEFEFSSKVLGAAKQSFSVYHHSNQLVVVEHVVTMTGPANLPCCPPGSWPMLVKEATDDIFEPKGEVAMVKTADGKDLKIYYVAPATPKYCIIVLQDVYSIRLFHSKSTSLGRIPAICDALAGEGFAVVLPDIFGDNPIDLAFQPPQEGENWTSQNLFAIDGVPGWFGKNTYESHEGELIACKEFLKGKQLDNLPVGALGFCFGTWLMTKTVVAGSFPFQAMVGCHPATIIESAIHGGDEAELLEAAQPKAPILFLCAGNDSDVFHENKPGRQALEKSGGGVIEYPDMVHGWVSRGDTSDEKVKKNMEKAMSEAVEFFKNKLVSK